MKIKRNFAITFILIGILLFAGASIFGFLIFEGIILNHMNSFEIYTFIILFHLFSLCFLLPGVKLAFDFKNEQKKYQFLKLKGLRLKTNDWVLIQNETFEINDVHPNYVSAKFELNGIIYEAKSEDRMEGFPIEGSDVTILYDPKNPKNCLIE